jgi:hypothetical protein
VSFFDDDEEAEPTRVRTEGARAPRPARAGGVGPRWRPPAGNRQAVRQRQIIAVVVVSVVIVLMGLLIHSCQVSDTTNSLKDYNNSVSQLIDRSDNTGSSLFSALKKPSSGLTQTVYVLHQQAASQLSSAEGLSVPGQMSTAQQNFVTAMRLRADGLNVIAGNVQEATNGSSTGAATQAVDAITAAMARFFASDVLYKTYTVPELAAALHNDSIPVGGTNGVTVNGGQFLPDLGWLSSTFVATTLGTTVGTASSGKVNAGDTPPASGVVVGHDLNSVSVGSTALSPTATNTLTASSSQTFVLSFTNGGKATEHNVQCTVSVVGASDSGATIVSETTPGETTSCSVTLKSKPPTGPYQVKAGITGVPGETNTANNYQTFTVDFQ